MNKKEGLKCSPFINIYKGDINHHIPIEEGFPEQQLLPNPPLPYLYLSTTTSN
jgi:hypothetical protein